MTSTIKYIVLAEDDFDDLLLFKMALEEVSWDIELEIAENGAKLLHFLEEILVPELIVLDLNMPLKSGKERLTEIRLQKRYNKVPIIMLSISYHDNDICYCLTHSANKYLTKSPSFLELKQTIESICYNAIHWCFSKISHPHPKFL